MQHIRCIESIVAQFVIDEFISREIAYPLHLSDDFIGTEQKSCLGELTFMEAIFSITDGAHREYDMDVGAMLAQQTDGCTEFLTHLSYIKCLFRKQPLRTFFTVVNHFSCFIQDIDVIGSQS